MPGNGMLIATTSAIIGISLISIFGVLVPSVPLIVVCTVLGLSALFAVAIDFPKYYLFKKFEL